MFKYGLYARKSDDDTSVTEKSIGEQVAECEVLAMRESLNILDTLKESKSARKPRIRPLYSELIALIEAGKLDAILCWHVNRLVRNMEEGGKLVQLLIDGVIKEIRTPHACYRSGDNILPIVIEAASATQYSLDLSNTVKRSMANNFRRGNVNNRTPQGYRNSRNPINLKQGITEPDPDRFPIIRLAWERILEGTHGANEVIDHINAVYGYRTRVTKKQGGVPLSKTAGYALFRNPFYMGFVRYKGELVQGHHVPMVTTDEFARVQQLLDAHTFQISTKKEHAFTGMMKCAFCGFYVTGEERTLRNGALWSNYRCANAKGTCTQKGIDAKTVEAKIASELVSIRLDPNYAVIVRDLILEALAEGPTPEVRDAIPRIERELKITEERLKNLEEMGISGQIRSRERYQELMQEELSKRERLVIERESLRSEAERMRLNAERSTQYVAFAHRTFLKAPKTRQKILATALADSYVFDGKAKRISINIRSLLREIVSFAESVQGSIEPPESSLQKQKEAALTASILCGGPKPSQIELPESLLRELRGPLFPELCFEDIDPLARPVSRDSKGLGNNDVSAEQT